MVNGMKRAGVEIEKAILTLKGSHGLTLCKVWTHRYVENENDNKSATVLYGYCDDVFKDYYDGCVKIDDGSGGLALKALETYQTYFSRSIITKGGDLHPLLPVNVAESSCCLALCLRNENLDYAFEFIFSLHDNNNNNTYAFLDSLVLKLRSCLPNFILSFDANIERQSLVLDVDTLIALEKQEEKEEDCKDRKFPRPLNIYGDALLRAKVEIQEAVKTTLIESHGLTLCQVWIHNYVENKDEKRAVKIGIYCAADFKDYFDACVNIQDGSGGFALKTLETYKPYFSTNIINGRLIKVTTAESGCCLTICLSNIYTGGLDYAFEFFFSLRDNNHITNAFLNSLLISLHSCLPSFKFPSGAQLGHYFKFETPNYTNFVNTNNDRGDLAGTDMWFCLTTSMKITKLKTEIGKRFNLVSNAYSLTYSFQGLTRPLWIQLENDQDLKMCIRLCRRKKILQLPIRVVPCPTSNPGIRAKSRHALLNITKNLIY